MMTINEAVQKLQDIAKQKGAYSTKLISIKDIFVEDWVRQKCEYGCKGYARHFTCPPYSPTPEETRRRLTSYENALLVNFEGLRQKEQQQKIHEIMFELEREAFLMGLYKAFSYSAGPCRRCEQKRKSCLAEKIVTPNEFSKKKCANQKRARPSMEACRINVFKTVRNAGYEIDVVQKEKDECFKSFGLLLLE